MKYRVLTSLLLAVATTLTVSAQWWETLNDSILNNLEQRALDANYNVDMAIRRVTLSQLQLQQTRSAYYPSVNVSAAYGKPGRHDPSVGNLQANLSWEIDLFGRVRQNANRNRAQIRASRADLEGARLSVAAAVAVAYVDLRTNQSLLHLRRRLARDQKNVADMVQVRYDTGLADRLDVAQSLMTYNATLATIPPTLTAIEQSLNSLAILLGVQRKDLDSLAVHPDSLVRLDVPIVPIELPANALRSRPDLIAAEAQIDAAAAAVGIAKKEYLPSLTLEGNITLENHSLNRIFSNESFNYSVMPTLSWTVFDGLSRRAAVATARENLRIAVDNYNATLLQGFAEVNNAITSYTNCIAARDCLLETVNQADVALQKAIALYKLDLTNFTSVMQSQMSAVDYHTQLIQTRSEVYTAFINFHKSLGI